MGTGDLGRLAYAMRLLPTAVTEPVGRAQLRTSTLVYDVLMRLLRKEKGDVQD
jgi:hypothetical protein